MQGSSAQKRPATPLDQLAYQRKLTYRRRVHANLEDRVREFLSASAGAKSIRVVLGRVVGRGTQQNVALPFASETILDGPEHEFEAALPQDAFNTVLNRIEAERQAWERTPPRQPRRWQRFTVSEGMSPVPSTPSSELTIYRGGDSFHFQLQARAQVVQSGEERRERRFMMDKGGGLWWQCLFCQQAQRFSIELEVNPSLLWEQNARMQSEKVHSFSVLTNDILRNARALGDLISSGREPLYYPGLLEPVDPSAPSAAVAEADAPNPVQKFYDVKPAEMRQHPEREATANVRRYNNLIKTLLLEKHVDDLVGSVRILDLACGHGQDISKYSRRHRKPSIDLYVGVDFAQGSLDEAKRRHKELVDRNPDDYAAAFYTGDLSKAETFERLRGDGHDVFDIVAMHFAISYLVASEEAAQALLLELRGLLRPGGRLLCALPSCEALAELFASAPADAEGPVELGNSLFKVRFEDEVRQRLEDGEHGEPEDMFAQEWGLAYTFTLAGAVEAQREYILPWDAFEALALANGFHVALDASFPDLLEQYGPQSRFFASVFSRQDGHGELGEEARQLFGLYSAFVLQRLDDSAEAEGSEHDGDDF